MEEQGNQDKDTTKGKQINVVLDPMVHRALRLESLICGKAMTELVTELLKDRLRDRIEEVRKAAISAA